MTATFSVKNFEKFQHYSNRTPPWIKLYNDLLENYEFGLLPDASRWHLIGIWLLASRSNNKIPLDPQWVAKRISASTPVDLSLLRNAGFIEFNQECSNVLAESEQLAMPEREEEGEVEQRKVLPPAGGERKSQSEYTEDFLAFWKAYPTDPNMSKKDAFTQWRKLTPEKRAQAIAAVPGFRAYCDKNKAWYRVVYAERFLKQEKFEGFEAAPALSPEEIADLADRADRLKKRGKYAVGMN